MVPLSCLLEFTRLISETPHPLHYFPTYLAQFFGKTFCVWLLCNSPINVGSCFPSISHFTLLWKLQASLALRCLCCLQEAELSGLLATRALLIETEASALARRKITSRNRKVLALNHGAAKSAVPSERLRCNSVMCLPREPQVLCGGRR